MSTPLTYVAKFLREKSWPLNALSLYFCIKPQVEFFLELVSRNKNSVKHSYYWDWLLDLLRSIESHSLNVSNLILLLPALISIKDDEKLGS